MARSLLSVFGADATHSVFVGGCTLGLYATARLCAEGRLATKLVAFEDRGPDVQSSVDCEDIVALAAETADLVSLVDAEGMRADVAALWKRGFDKYGFGVDDLSDVPQDLLS